MDRDPRILRLPKVIGVTGLSRSTIYRMMRTGEFPAQVSIGPRTVGWRESEVIQWVESRPAASR